MAVVGSQPLALNQGANQNTGHACGAKKCFIATAAAGNITTTVNKGRRARPMSRLLLLDVYGDGAVATVDGVATVVIVLVVDFGVVTVA